MTDIKKTLNSIPNMIGLFFLGILIWFLDAIILTFFSLGCQYVIHQEIPSGQEIAQASSKLYLYIFFLILSVIFKTQVPLKFRLWVIVKGSVIIFSILLLAGAIISFLPLSKSSLFILIAIGFILQIVMFIYSVFILPKKLLKKYDTKKTVELFADSNKHQTTASKEDKTSYFFEKTNNIITSLNITRSKNMFLFPNKIISYFKKIESKNLIKIIVVLITSLVIGAISVTTNPIKKYIASHLFNSKVKISEDVKFYGKTHWGMPMEEVQSLYPNGKLEKEEYGLTAYVLDREVAGFKCETRFVFHRNFLISVGLRFINPKTSSFFGNDEESEKLLSDVTELLESKYGEPYENRERTQTDANGSWTEMTSWMGDSTLIALDRTFHSSADGVDLVPYVVKVEYYSDYALKQSYKSDGL